MGRLIHPVAHHFHDDAVDDLPTKAKPLGCR